MVAHLLACGGMIPTGGTYNTIAPRNVSRRVPLPAYGCPSAPPSWIVPPRPQRHRPTGDRIGGGDCAPVVPMTPSAAIDRLPFRSPRRARCAESAGDRCRRRRGVRLPRNRELPPRPWNPSFVLECRDRARHSACSRRTQPAFLNCAATYSWRLEATASEVDAPASSRARRSSTSPAGYPANRRNASFDVRSRCRGWWRSRPARSAGVALSV